jgi:7,8-dihydropterin-6-yl-methyl-4-(beta-D-ribofuranosyl)aminobenzene 5'-phosphate synthase
MEVCWRSTLGLFKYMTTTGEDILKDTRLNEINKLEIITLEDNYIDLVAMDDSEVVTRAIAIDGNEMSRSTILAEHGFSAFVRITDGDHARAMIFDFGYSEDVVIRNAMALGVDLEVIEAAALSHGHIDHFGGLEAVGEKLGKKGLELVVHPAAFRKHRFFISGNRQKINLPHLERSHVKAAGFKLIETKDPYLMLDCNVLFLGEIPRTTPFEKGTPYVFFKKDGKEIWDPIEDDSALVMNLQGKGLVVLSGCAHSGIINTIEYAIKITGIQKVHAVIGGFHLTGPAFEPIIGKTVEAFKEIAPSYIVPTHCSGRNAIQAFEREMPDAFILNMSGTALTFM